MTDPRTVDWPDQLSARERRHRERRLWRNGLLASALLHLIIFFGWRGSVLPMSPFAAAGPRAGDFRAAAGGMQTVNIRSAVPVSIVPPPVPLAVEVEVEPVDFPEEAAMDAAALLGERPGLAEGPGVADGTGRGDGGNADEGLNRLQPPSPRGMIIPPTHASLRGTEVQVWVFVDEAGRVVADSTRLDPPTRDRDFNRQLVREASEWVFRPALQGGLPVSSWFPYRISM